MATRGLGQLTIDFIAKTGGFEQGVNQAERRFQRFGKEVESESQRIDRSIKAVTLVMGGLATAAVATAAAMYKATAGSIDSLNKMSRQIGVTTEALSAMRFAAQQTADIGDGTFDKVLRRMTRRIASAAEGAGAASGALKALGLSAQEMGNLSADQQFLKIAEAMSHVNSRGEQLRHVFNLFGAEGQVLVDTLGLGADAFEEMMQKAERYGAVISSIDAQAVEDAQSAIGDAAAALDAMQKAVTVGIAPYLKETAETITDAADRLGGFGKIAETTFELVSKAALATAAVMAGRFVQSIALKGKALVQASVEAARYQRTLMLMQTGLTSTAAQTATLTAAQSAQVATAGALATAQRGLSVAYGAVGGALGVATLALTAGVMAWNSYNKSARESRELIDSMQLSAEELTERLSKLNRAQALGMQAKNLKAQAAAAKEVNNAYGELITSMRDIGMRKLRLPTSEIEEYTHLINDAYKQGQDLTPVLEQIAAKAGLPLERIGEWYELNKALIEAQQQMEGTVRVGDALQDMLHGVGDAGRDASSGVSALSDDLEKLVERTRLQAITAGLKTELDKFLALEKEGEYDFGDNTAARDAHIANLKAIDAANEAARQSAKSSSAAANAAKSLKREIDSLVESLFPAIKAQSELDKNTKLVDAALKAGTITTDQHKEALKKLNKEFEKSTRSDTVKKILEQNKAAKEANKTLADQIKYYGLAGSALTFQKREETLAAIATAESRKQTLLAAGASKERIDEVQKEIAALKELSATQADKINQEALLEAGEQYKEAGEKLKQANDEIARDLEQSLMNAIVEGGQTGFKDILNWAKNAFKSLVLRPILAPIVQGAAGAVTGAMGMSGAGGIDPITGLSAAKNLAGGLSWFTDFSGNVGDRLFDLGMDLQQFDGVLGNLGDTVLGNIDSISKGLDVAGAAWNYGKGIFDLSKGKYGAGIGSIGGQLIGGPIGGAIGNAIGGALDKYFGGKETRSGGGFQYIDGSTRFVGGPSGGFGGQAVISELDNYFGDIQDTIDGFLEGIGSTARTAGLYGSFESSERGRGGTQSGGQLVIDGQVFTFGVSGKGSGYGGKTGTTEEMLANMQKDMYYSILEAWQLVGDDLPRIIGDQLADINIREALGAEDAQAMVEQLTQVVQLVNSTSEALSALPLQNLNDLSFDLTHALLEAAGSIEALQSSLTGFYQGFYTEEERFAIGTEQALQQLRQLGIELPGSAKGWRDLINSIEIVDAESAQLYNSLLNLSGAMSQIYAEADRVAAESLQAERKRYDGLIQQSKDFAKENQDAAREQLKSEQDAINNAYRARNDALRASINRVNETMRALESLSTAAQRSFTSLFGMTEDGAQGLREAARETVQMALAAGRLGKSLTGFKDLSEAISTVSSLSSNIYTTFSDYERERLGSALELKELSDIAGDQASVQELQLRSLEAQTETIKAWRDSQLAQAQSQYEELVDFYEQQHEDLVAFYENEYKELEKAEKARSEAALAELLEQNALSLQSMNMDSEHTQHIASTIADRASAIISAINSIDVRPVVNVSSYSPNYPFFATGGLHTGGGRVVGELGPEFDVTGPARIHTTEQLKRLFGDGGADGAEEKEDRRKQLDYAYSQTKTLGQIKRTLERMEAESIERDRINGGVF